VNEAGDMRVRPYLVNMPYYGECAADMRVRPYPVNMPYYSECAVDMRWIRLAI